MSPIIINDTPSVIEVSSTERDGVVSSVLKAKSTFERQRDEQFEKEREWVRTDDANGIDNSKSELRSGKANKNGGEVGWSDGTDIFAEVPARGFMSAPIEKEQGSDMSAVAAGKRQFRLFEEMSAEKGDQEVVDVDKEEVISISSENVTAAGEEEETKDISITFNTDIESFEGAVITNKAAEVVEEDDYGLLVEEEIEAMEPPPHESVLELYRSNVGFKPAVLVDANQLTRRRRNPDRHYKKSGVFVVPVGMWTKLPFPTRTT